MLDCPSDFRASFLGQPGIGVGGAGVRLIAPLLAAPGPRQLPSALRPAGGVASGAPGPPPAGGSALEPGLGWNDLWLAQAWISVPSTEKCSCDMSASTRGCATTAVNSRWAT